MQIELKLTTARLARWCLAFIFVYHGLVPKILILSPIEVAMIEAHQSGLDPRMVAMFGGIAEIILGFWIAISIRAKWPIYIALFALLALLVDVLIFMPSLLVEAFNPVTINVAGICLCWIALISDSESPAK